MTTLERHKKKVKRNRRKRSWVRWLETEWTRLENTGDFGPHPEDLGSQVADEGEVEWAYLEWLWSRSQHST